MDPALAEAIHASDGPKPLTCSALLPAGPAPPARRPADSVVVRPGERYRARVTGLTGPVSRALWAGSKDETRDRVWVS